MLQTAVNELRMLGSPDASGSGSIFVSCHFRCGLAELEPAAEGNERKSEERHGVSQSEAELWDTLLSDSTNLTMIRLIEAGEVC